MDISLVFKLGGLGIVMLIIGKVMESGGKRDMALIVELTGIMIGLITVVSLTSKLFSAMNTMFTF